MAFSCQTSAANALFSSLAALDGSVAGVGASAGAGSWILFFRASSSGMSYCCM
jgi:hypothetical protein